MARNYVPNAIPEPYSFHLFALRNLSGRMIPVYAFLVFPSRIVLAELLLWKRGSEGVNVKSAYRTENALSRKLRVRYPVEDGSQIVLRTELDWDSDLEPISISDNGQIFTFHLETKRPYLYFKPCMRTKDNFYWAAGENKLVLMTTQGIGDVYPVFHSDSSGSYSEVITIESTILNRAHQIRVYFPPGYHENQLRRYPVVYMQDGKNLFFPEEAFLGKDWRVNDSLELLDAMNAADQVIIVGVYSGNRFQDYTRPGYENYGRSIVEEIKPYIDQEFRTLPEHNETAVMGSSLGGVVSFYLGWEWPDVFGSVACLSSPFSHQDDLIERVLEEPRRETRFYLDSGWPGDNYEVTCAMAMALFQRGYIPRQDFIHFVFPLALHEEYSWGDRLHLPLQLFLGKVSTARRGRYW